jgi:hypothetical protein
MMLNLSVRDFRDFLIGKIVATTKAQKLSEREREKRADVLREIVHTELFDSIYDRHDTMWMLEQAEIMRSEAGDYLRQNDQRIQDTMKKLEVARGRIDFLNASLRAYKDMDLSEHDFVEREALEAKEEIEDEIRETEQMVQAYMEELNPVKYNRNLMYVLHRLEGIITNPNYFSYLK